MKNKLNPLVAAVVLLIVLSGVGFYLSRAFNAGVVGKTYAPGEVPQSYVPEDSPGGAATARDAAQTGDPDGK
jgi:hypothetical protein